MTYRLAEIAQAVSGQLEGEPDRLINGIAALDKAKATELSFLHNSAYQKHLANTEAGAVILSQDDSKSCTADKIIVPDSRLAYAKAAELFVADSAPLPGVHSTAVVASDCQIDSTASIGPHVVLGKGVRVGADTRIDAGCVLGPGTSIGHNCHLHANVTVYPKVMLGDRVIVHSGAVLGSDGFGHVQDKEKWRKIPQLGAVRIGNDVEIGSNTAIDRGAIDDTIIEEGVKLDNLVQVGHNVSIGAHTVIAGCTAIAGSTRIGRHCLVGGACSISGYLEIADKVILAGTAAVHNSIKEPGLYSSGVPLQPHADTLKCAIRFKQLGKWASRLRKLEGHLLKSN